MLTSKPTAVNTIAAELYKTTGQNMQTKVPEEFFTSKAKCFRLFIAVIGFLKESNIAVG